MVVSTRVAALITTFNDRLSLISCLQSLVTQSYEITSILVIDNSYESQVDLVDFPNVCIEIQHYPHNLGVAGALKHGIEWAIEHQFDYLWTFDQDSTVSFDALEILIESSNLLIS